MRKTILRLPTFAAASCALCLVITPVPSLAEEQAARQVLQCARSCLTARLESYLGALATRAPQAVAWGPGAKFTENSIPLRPGQGLWATAGRIGAERQVFVDPVLQSVVFFGTVEENGNRAILGVRLRYADDRLVDAEHLVVRNQTAAGKFAGRAIPVRELRDAAAPRSSLAATPDSYFNALERTSTRDARFSPGCVRVENGEQTTGVRDLQNGPFLELESDSWRAILAEGCAASIDSGANAHITQARDRRILALDEEQGVAVAAVVFAHDGTVSRITRGERSIVFPRQLQQPFDTLIFEAFELDAESRIDRVEAIGIQIPYGAPSGW
jgi:hypothetical protein